MIHTFESTAVQIPTHRDRFRNSGYQAVVKIALPGVEAFLGIRTQDKTLVAIEVLGSGVPEQSPTGCLGAEVVGQLEAYFRDPHWHFSLPLLRAGTPFQRRVWEALMAIPAGETQTYGELARQVGGGPRAVGGACRSNPVPIVIPCHRVVSTTGLGGYMGETAGAGLALKARLLAHEGLA